MCQDRKLCIVKTSFFLKKNSKILYTSKIIFFIKQTDTSRRVINCDMTQKFSSVNLFFKLNLFPFSNAASKKRVLSYEKISRYSSNRYREQNSRSCPSIIRRASPYPYPCWFFDFLFASWPVLRMVRFT